jgi:hypothetical protein
VGPHFCRDYRLLNWPTANGVTVALGGEPDNFVGRKGATPSTSETYFGYLPPTWATIPTTDLQGTLRLVRSGTTSTAS